MNEIITSLGIFGQLLIGFDNLFSLLGTIALRNYSYILGFLFDGAILPYNTFFSGELTASLAGITDTLAGEIVETAFKLLFGFGSTQPFIVVVLIRVALIFIFIKFVRFVADLLKSFSPLIK